jgi:hypothetical protein
MPKTTTKAKRKSESTSDSSRPTDRLEIYVGIDPGVTPAVTMLATYSGTLLASCFVKLSDETKLNSMPVSEAISSMASMMVGNMRHLCEDLASSAPDEWQDMILGPSDVHFCVEDVAGSVRPGQSPSSTAALASAHAICVGACHQVGTLLKSVAQISDLRAPNVRLEEVKPQAWRAYFAMNDVDGSGDKTTKQVSSATAQTVERLLDDLSMEIVKNGALSDKIGEFEGTSAAADQSDFSDHNMADAYLLAAYGMANHQYDWKFFKPLATQGHGAH